MVVGVGLPKGPLSWQCASVPYHIQYNFAVADIIPSFPLLFTVRISNSHSRIPHRFNFSKNRNKTTEADLKQRKLRHYIYQEHYLPNLTQTQIDYVHAHLGQFPDALFETTHKSF